MNDKRDNGDEKAFNETLKRMLETPPKPHDKGGKDKREEKQGKKD